MIVHWNNRDNYFWIQEAPKECYEATVPTEVPDDVKAECGDLEVVYVKSVDCPAGIVTRSIFLLYWFSLPHRARVAQWVTCR